MTRASSSPARPVRSRCPVALGLAAGQRRDRDRPLPTTRRAASVSKRPACSACRSISRRVRSTACRADVDYVCNFAVVKSNKWDIDLAGNAEAAGLLMAHCRSARAFLHCSSTGVYEAADGSPQRETDPLGDNHRVMMPTYSISKIAAEAVVRTTCRIFDVPDDDRAAQRAVRRRRRLARVPSRADARRAGRSPCIPNGPSRFNPIHDDDILATLPGMLAAATVPATIVNWGGDEETSIEEWCEYMAELVGVEAALRPHAEHDRRHPDRQHQARARSSARLGGLEGRHAPDGRGSGRRAGQLASRRGAGNGAKGLDGGRARSDRRRTGARRHGAPRRRRLRLGRDRSR